MNKIDQIEKFLNQIYKDLDKFYKFNLLLRNDKLLFVNGFSRMLFVKFIRIHKEWKIVTNLEFSSDEDRNIFGSIKGLSEFDCDSILKIIQPLQRDLILKELI